MAEGDAKPATKGASSKARAIIWVCIVLAFAAILATFLKFTFFSSGPKPEEPTATVEPGEYIPLGTTGSFVTNLRAPDQDIIVSVKISGEIDAKKGSSQSESIKLEVAGKNKLIQQLIEEVLGSRTREQVDNDLAGVRQEILRKVNAELRQGELRQVLTEEKITTPS